MIIKHTIELDEEDVNDVSRAIETELDKVNMGYPNAVICKLLAVAALKAIVKKF